jgi:hypothetical protein
VKQRPQTVRLAALCAVVFLVAVPACSSTSAPTPAPGSVPTTTSTTSGVSLPHQSAAVVAACIADAKTVEVALDAYMAEKGTYPSPPLPWSAANYSGDYQPLTAASDGGPYLHGPPGTASYVIEYDSAGHIWIAPPGQYSPSYNAGQDFDSHPDICLPAAN